MTAAILPRARLFGLASSRRASAGVLCALAVVLAACGGGGGGGGGSTGSGSATTGRSATGGQPGRGKPTIVMGDKNFTEELILGQLYTQALRAKGYTVVLKSDLGSSEITDQALTSGQIQMYPEYTGTILSELAHQTKRPASAQATYEAAKAFEQSRGFTLLTPTPFYDTDALAVTKSYGSAHHFTTISDLKPLGSSVTLGGPPEFKTRFEGLIGMAQVYGITQIGFKPLSIGLQYAALDSNAVQVADVFTTDGQLSSGKYSLLSDPKNIFGFQNVAPVVSQKLLSREGPAFASTLDAVSATLTNEAIRKMNAAVDLDKVDPAVVAKDFLQANGLLKP